MKVSADPCELQVDPGFLPSHETSVRRLRRWQATVRRENNISTFGSSSLIQQPATETTTTPRSFSASIENS